MNVGVALSNSGSIDSPISHTPYGCKKLENVLADVGPSSIYREV